MHSGGLHRGSDGGPHAGIRRQEDRAEGSKDGDARGDRHAFSILVFSGHFSLGQMQASRAEGLLESAGPGHREPEQPGPHGFSEILYAYSSGTGNNGSAFGGISANTPWYNLTLGLGDADRPFPVLDSAARSGRKSGGKKKDSRDGGTFPTHGPLFVGLLVGTVFSSAR